MRCRAVVVVLCVTLAACSDGLPQSGASCPSSVCSDRGTCAFQDTYPVCTCDDGYTGAACSRCADKFHRAADDSCVADEECTPAACANGGACFIDEHGTVACACALGYGGATCQSCRAGYHGLDDGGCVLDETCHETSCARGGTCHSDAGRVSCTCNAGRSGEFCEVHTESCDELNPCTSAGRCADQTGVVRCVCQPGYGGPTCATCAAGFVDSGAGCVLGGSCTPASCSFVGSCAVDAGVAACTCQAGYAGARCDQCASGFHRAIDYSCVPNQTCQTSSRCSVNGSCREVSGDTVCDCGNGYAGISCETCAPGFHAQAAADGGTQCELDTLCRPETCRFHGNCASDGGTTSCQCQSGYSGANCETNIDDCVNSACNGFRCVDLLTSYVCLCDGGVYAQGCQ